MKSLIKIKNELQRLILGNGQAGGESKLETVQNFLRRHAQSGGGGTPEKFLKSEKEKLLIDFASSENLFYSSEISEADFIAEGAEQRVYRYNDFQVIKTNDAIFYETWLDYFNNLLIHNYLFKATAYDFLGFKIIGEKLFAVVRQDFIVADDPTDLNFVKQFLEYNGFKNTRNNDYYNEELGIIFEDLHDENVLSKNKILFFIDTVFYLTENFYENLSK